MTVRKTITTLACLVALAAGLKWVLLPSPTTKQSIQSKTPKTNKKNASEPFDAQVELEQIQEQFAKFKTQLMQNNERIAKAARIADEQQRLLERIDAIEAEYESGSIDAAQYVKERGEIGRELLAKRTPQ